MNTDLFWTDRKSKINGNNIMCSIINFSIKFKKKKL